MVNEQKEHIILCSINPNYATNLVPGPTGLLMQTATKICQLMCGPLLDVTFTRLPNISLPCTMFPLPITSNSNVAFSPMTVGVSLHPRPFPLIPAFFPNSMSAILSSTCSASPARSIRCVLISLVWASPIPRGGPPGNQLVANRRSSGTGEAEWRPAVGSRRLFVSGGSCCDVVRRSTLKMRGRGGEGGNTEERRRGKELDGTGRLKEGEAVTGTARVT